MLEREPEAELLHLLLLNPSCLRWQFEGLLEVLATENLSTSTRIGVPAWNFIAALGHTSAHLDSYLVRAVQGHAPLVPSQLDTF